MSIIALLAVFAGIAVLLGLAFAWSTCIVAGQAEDAARRLEETLRHD